MNEEYIRWMLWVVIVLIGVTSYWFIRQKKD